MTRKDSPFCGEPEKSCRLVLRQDKTGKDLVFNLSMANIKVDYAILIYVQILDSDFKKRENDIIFEE